MKSKHFRIEELVPKHIFAAKGDKAWQTIDSRVIETIDLIKDRFPNGTMIINNWFWGGEREWSGLRTSDSPYFSWTSQHTFGRAIDSVFSHYNIQDIRQDIIDNPEIYIHVKGIELDVDWLHIDVRNNDTLLQFKA